MIICADDYGLRDDINQAILDLVSLGKLSAVSCMVLFERCDNKALNALLAHRANVDIGLHLCLSDEHLPLSSPLTHSLPDFTSLFQQALFKRIEPHNIARLASVQYDLFTQKCGCRPDYIDGHLHAHQLPGVRQGLIDFVQSLPREHRPYIRNTWMPVAQIRRRKLPWVKAALIGVCGGRIRSLLCKADIMTNDGFVGIYDFKQWLKYPGYLPKFLDCLSAPNGILVVHPGLNDKWRRQEFESLRDFSAVGGRLNRFLSRPL